MRRLKLVVEYDGSDFYGWQVQSRTHERTVQGVLQEAWERLPGQRTSLRAAGRTDAGVHAVAMTAHLDTDTPVEDAKLARALNAHLPPDVRVLNVEKVSNDFEAQYSCLYRAYRYRIRLTRGDLSGAALEHLRVLHLNQALDVTAMQQAAPLFEGKRDFAALATQETRTTLRTVYLCHLDVQGRDLTLTIAADGFLRGMVRATVGTLLEVGAGKLELTDIPELLALRDRSKAGKNVAPHGLYFLEAGYEAWSGETRRRLLGS